MSGTESIAISPITLVFFTGLKAEPSLFLLVSLDKGRKYFELEAEVQEKEKGRYSWACSSPIIVPKGQDVIIQPQFTEHVQGGKRRIKGEITWVSGKGLSQLCAAGPCDWIKERHDYELRLELAVSNEEPIDAVKEGPGDSQPRSSSPAILDTPGQSTVIQPSTPRRRQRTSSSASDETSSLSPKKRKLPGINRGTRALCRVYFTHAKTSKKKLAEDLGMNDSVITEIIDNTPGDDNLDSDWDYVSEAVRKKYKPKPAHRGGIPMHYKYEGNMTRDQRAFCRIRWKYEGLTQFNIAAVLGTNVTQIQLATQNTAGDNLDSDWDHVPLELSRKYKGKAAKKTPKRRGPNKMNAKDHEIDAGASPVS